jgi:hypothetical protein
MPKQRTKRKKVLRKKTRGGMSGLEIGGIIAAAVVVGAAIYKMNQSEENMFSVPT